jgi:hypothetical protein
VAERTQSQTLVIEDFKGLNQVIDEIKLPSSHTPWAHGGYFNEKAEFERLQGKQLHSSVTTGGSVLTLKQLQFTDKDVLLVHQSSSYLVESDLTTLTSSEDTSTLSPMEPFILG